MYGDNLAQWIPVQLTWIRGLSKEYYNIHFFFFQQFFKQNMTQKEGEDLACQVVDFLEAQTKGFALAYMEGFHKQSKEVSRSKL